MDMDIDTYLRRIDLAGVEQADLKTLERLQMQHMLHVPFENLDVMNHVPIPLDVETYYNKIVQNRRGGFCYELNGLFNWLLQQLGYQSQFVSGTINRPDGSWAKEGSHATQIVELDAFYLVDVGFGDSARVPIPLNGETREDVSGIYRAQQVDDRLYDLQRKESADEWDTLFRFDTTPKTLADFSEACHFNQTSPKSHFTKKEMASIATLDGRVTLSGDTLTITQNDEKQKLTIESDVQRTALLNQYFAISLG